MSPYISIYWFTIFDQKLQHILSNLYMVESENNTGKYRLNDLLARIYRSKLVLLNASSGLKVSPFCVLDMHC